MNSAFSRPNWAVIHLENLRHNARTLAQHAAPAQLLAVIKAGAYGHGAYHVAHALQNENCVRFFGVASVDEGQQLRGLGIEKPILLLSAILPDEVADAVSHDLSPTIFTTEIARRVSLESARQNKTTRAHFKVNTGMNRLGAHFSEAARVFAEIRALPNLEIEGVYTHMACADDFCDELTPLQIARFSAFLSEIGGAKNLVKHAANSATTLRYSGAHFDLVRPGIALYGAHPCPDCDAARLDLRPVMTWKSRVTAVQTVRAGESVSYGAIWRATQNTRVAVVACGYADGYFRSLSGANFGEAPCEGGQILIRGAKFPVVGRVTMDQILVNIGDFPCEIGDEVTLWGEGLPVEDVAARAGTISYELLCSVSSRVPRVIIG